MLLDVCVALELLAKNRPRFKNAPISSEFLVKGKPNYFGNFVSLESYSYLTWSNLTQAIRQNGPVVLPMKDERMLRFFAHAMHSASVFSAALLAQVVDLSSHKKLLDIGSGSGVNASIPRRWS